VRKLLYKLGLKLISWEYTRPADHDALAIHSLRRRIAELEYEKSRLHIELSVMRVRGVFDR